MRKILFVTTSPTVGGNGDALIEAALDAALAQGAQVERVDLRNYEIGHCKACYGCAATGVCVQQDDFAPLLKKLHEADGVVLSAPIYYNCMASQAIVAIDRLCCTFACKSYQVGPKKRVAFLLTCTGSEPEEMRRHVRNILTLPSLNRAIEDFRTEVFTGCGGAATCSQSREYMALARAVGEWTAEN